MYNFMFRWTAAFVGLLMVTTAAAQPFQRTFGTATDNAFTKVIQHGSSYYVLGRDVPAGGGGSRATVTRLNAQGQLQWTTGLNSSSQWNDAVLTPSGNLLLVGNTLPLGSGTDGIMGLITSSGNFSWLRTYNTTGRDAFTRVVRNPAPSAAAFPYYVLGYQFQTTPTIDDVVLLTVAENGAMNWKKIYNGIADDEFVRDLEALPNGDLILAGNQGSEGVIFRADNAGNIYGGVTPAGWSFTYTDVAPRSGGGFYAVGQTFPAVQCYLMRYDNDLIDVWNVSLSNLTAVTQVWEGGNGNDLYVVGTQTIGGLNQTVLMHFTDVGNGASLDWLRYLDNGETAYSNGGVWRLSGSAIAYVDGRTPVSGGFGLLCAFMSVSDLDLNTCMTQNGTVGVQAATPLYNGPLGPDIAFFEVPIPTNIGSTPLTWQEQTACPATPCVADFNFQLVNCGATVSFTNLSTGPTPLTYFWDLGISTNGIPATSTAQNPVITYPAQCSTYTVCLTVTGNGCSNTICKNITIKYPQTPVLTCPPQKTIACDDDLTPTVSGFATLTGACSGQAANITYSDAFTGQMPCDATVVRTWSATDECGGSHSCVQIIAVMDNVPPAIMCPQNVQLTCTGPTSPAATGFASATDNCSIPLVTFSDAVTGNAPCNQLIVRTWTATDDCTNTATCVQTISVMDNLPPSINCPPTIAVTALAPDCDIPVYNIQSLGATDNCSTPAVSYAITGATTASGAGDAGGNIFSTGSSTVTYTATDACNNTASCSFNVIVECDTCACLGFSGLEFYNFLGGPDIAAACDTIPVDLPCIGKDALYWFRWQLLCSDPLCLQSVSYSIVPAGGGPALISGNIPPGNPHFISFAYAQLAGPGNYQIILTGLCGTSSCTCTINFAVPSCCECGGVEDLTFRPAQGAPSLPIACGDTVSMPCNQVFYPRIGGAFTCVGTLCPQPTEQTLQWSLKDPNGFTFQSGPVQASPFFQLPLDPYWFAQAGFYTLTIGGGQCGGQTCPACVIYLQSAGCEQPMLFDCGMAVTTFQPQSYNLSEKVLSIRDIRNRASVPPLVHWPAPEINHPKWTYGDLGSIFGIALDQNNNIYVSATSAYVTSWPNTNFYGPAGSGGIYRIDAVTGVPTTFVKTAPIFGPPILGQNRLPNALTGLGNLCYDKDFNQFFVTNMEDGRIYRLDGNNGNILSVFDPFAPDNDSPGMVCESERIWGIGIYNHRIYFNRCSELGGTPNRIYSVGRNQSTGDFDFTNGEALEISVSPLFPDNPSVISDIEFSADGKMLLGERSEFGDPCVTANPVPTAHESRVLEYVQNTAQVWVPSPRTFAIGHRNYNESAAGGVDYGYDDIDLQNGVFGRCDSMVWATGDALDLSIDNVYGFAGLPATGSIWFNDAWIVDADLDLTTIPKTHLGDVDIIHCGCPAEENTCNCLGFAGLTFSNGTDFGSWTVPMSCGGTPGDALPCIGSDGFYYFNGTLLCSGPQCVSNISYKITPLGGGPAIASGTFSGSNAFTLPPMPYTLFPAPGDYQIVLSGQCGSNTCTCIVPFTIMTCKTFIHGIVYADVNCSAGPYTNQPGLEGWKITFQDEFGNTVDSATTDKAGLFFSWRIPPGVYIVKAAAPQSGWTFSTPLDGIYTITLEAQDTTQTPPPPSTVFLPFGACSVCDCSAVQFSVNNYDDCCYYLQVQNSASYCFPSIDITLNSGQFDQVVPNGWTVNSLGPDHLQLIPPGGYIPNGASAPVQFCVTGNTTPSFSVTTTYDDNGQITGCGASILSACTAGCQTPCTQNNLWQDIALAGLFAMTEFQGKLILAGGFGQIGTQTGFNNIAAWDGSTFTPMGAGLPGGNVFALAVHNGKLYAAGQFANPTGGVAVWDPAGATWSGLDGGVGFSNPAVPGYVYALLSTPAGLVVGGNFNTAGVANPLANVTSIAVWDDTQGKWVDNLGGTLVSGIGFLSDIRSLALYNGQLIAGGSLSLSNNTNAGVAAWDGQNWQSLTIGDMFGYVNAMAQYGGKLYVGGSFLQANGLPGTQKIAAWDGQIWESVGGGVPVFFNNFETINALSVYNGKLYAAGNFTQIGITAANVVAEWDPVGKSWLSTKHFYQPVQALATYQQPGQSCTLYSGGGTLRRWICQTIGTDETSGAAGLRLYPNPTPHRFTLELPYPAPAGLRYRILDLTGRATQEGEIQTNSTREMIDAGGLPNGMYFLQVLSGGQILGVERLVKQ